MLDNRTGLAVFVDEDIERVKEEAIRRMLPMEGYEVGYYEDEFHPKGMWFFVHYQAGEPAAA